MAREKGYTARRPGNIGGFGASFIDQARKQLGLKTGQTSSGRHFVKGTPAQKRAARLKAIQLAKEDARQEMGKHKASLKFGQRSPTQSAGKAYRNNTIARQAGASARIEQITRDTSASELSNKVWDLRLHSQGMMQSQREELGRIQSALDGRYATLEDKKRAVEILLQQGENFQ